MLRAEAEDELWWEGAPLRINPTLWGGPEKAESSVPQCLSERLKQRVVAQESRAVCLWMVLGGDRAGHIEGGVCAQQEVGVNILDPRGSADPLSVGDGCDSSPSLSACTRVRCGQGSSVPMV